MPPIRRRYILYKIDPEVTLPKKPQQPSFTTNEGEIVNTVREAVRKMHGDFGLASILLNFFSKKFDLTTRTGVLVVKRESYYFVLTSLPFVRLLHGHNVSISILKISGTLRGCLRSLQGYHGKMIAEYRKKLKERKGTNLNKSSAKDTQLSIDKIDAGIDSIRKSLQQ